MEEGEDVNLALLTYKTTPLSHKLPGPAELLNSRKYKTPLPTCIVPTRLQIDYKQIVDQGKQLQAQLYTKGSRVLPRLEQSQRVVLQLDPDRNIWTPAETIQGLTDKGRSYSLKTIHGGIYTRNRRFIKPDSTAAETQAPRPALVPRMTRPTRTIKSLTDLLSLNKTHGSCRIV